MSRGMVAFLAGLGGGYLKAKDQNRAREREAKDDAWRDEQRDRQRAEWQKQDKLDADLRDATAERTAVQGTVTEGADGNKVLTTDPSQTAAIQKTMAEEAELRGEAAPTSRAGAGVVGMARGNEITDGPADTAALNTRAAREQRVLGALSKNGQVERALSMEGAMLDRQAKQLGLDTAQAQFADEQFNRRLTERLTAGTDWTQGAADILTESQVGGLAGATVVARPTADGKRVEFVAERDGKSRVLGAFDQGDAGRAQFMQQIARVPLTTKIGWLVEGEKTKREEDRWQKTFDFNKKKEENDQQYRQRVLGLQMAQERRLAEVHAMTMQDAKIPPGVKLQAQTLAKQMETANAALSKAMAEGLFDPNNQGTAELIKQQRVLGLQYQRLMAPYIPGAENKGDPLGLNAGGADVTPGAGAPPAQGAPGAGAIPAPAAPTSGLQLGPGGGYMPPQAAATGPMQQAAARQQPSVAEVIAGPGAAGSPALLASAQQKATVIEGLAAQIREAQAGVAMAARGGGDVGAAMAQVAAIQAQLTQALAGMNEQQAAKVLAAAGIQ